MGYKREMDHIEQDLHKLMMRDLNSDAMMPISNSTFVRNVDEAAVNNCRVKTFKRLRSETQRMVVRNGDEEDLQKVRAREGRYNPLCEIPMEESLERMYFEKYGEGFDGGPVMDRPYTNMYVCPCGLRMMASAKTLDLTCPRCGRLTPKGRLVEDGHFHR